MPSIIFDPIKRQITLERRSLDMARAQEIFEGSTLTVADDRRDYGEQRLITIEHLDGRMIVLVWTWRGTQRRIISLRKANDRETRRYHEIPR